MIELLKSAKQNLPEYTALPVGATLFGGFLKLAGDFEEKYLPNADIFDAINDFAIEMGPVISSAGSVAIIGLCAPGFMSSIDKSVTGR